MFAKIEVNGRSGCTRPTEYHGMKHFVIGAAGSPCLEPTAETFTASLRETAGHWALKIDPET